MNRTAILFWYLVGVLVLDLVFNSKDPNVSRAVPQAYKMAALLLPFALVRQWKISPVFTLYCLFYVVSLVSALWLTSVHLNTFPLGEVVKLSFAVLVCWCFDDMCDGDESARKFIANFAVIGFIVYGAAIIRDFSDLSLIREGKEFFVSNNSYRFLAFFPVMYVVHERWRSFLIVITGLILLLALKRGPILIFALLVLMLLILQVSRAKRSRLKAFLLFGTIFISLASLIYFSESFLDLLIKQVEFMTFRAGDFSSFETAGSGRGGIYIYLLSSSVLSGELWPTLIGNGALSSFQALELAIGNSIHAHSDLIEILHSFGLLGTIFIFSFLGLFWQIFHRASQANRLCVFLIGFILAAQMLVSSIVFSVDIYVYLLFLIYFYKSGSKHVHNNIG